MDKKITQRHRKTVRENNMEDGKGANRRLGELLIREDIITRTQLEEALREKHTTGTFLGETLVRLRYITEDELIGFLVRQCRIPHIKLSKFQVRPEAAQLIPADICRDYKLLPIDKLGNLLTVAMVNPLDVETLEKVKRTVKLRIKPILCSWGDFKELYARIYGLENQENEPIDDEEEPDEAPPEEPKVAKAPEPLQAAPKSGPTPEPAEKEKPPETKEPPRANGLIERFRFDNFVVAEANSFTYALAKSISESPGYEYNPFFIYGNSGLGKTHLSNAIGNEVVSRHSEMVVVYIPASRFIDEMLDAVEHEHMKEFRERYSRVDMLVIDDIQFLSGRPRAQEEFFNIFNELYNKKKQIIVISDVTPKKLQGLEARLISRFEGGVVACMEEPDFQTRLTILQQRSEAAGAIVPEDVLKLLATSIPSNIRELEGALKKLLAYSSLVGHEITVELAQEILKHLFKTVES